MKESIVEKIHTHAILYQQIGRKPPALAIKEEEADILKQKMFLLFTQKLSEEDCVTSFYGV